MTTLPENPTTRLDYHGAHMDAQTMAALMVCEADLGRPLHPTQGCYSHSSVTASSTTHNGGGALDLDPDEMDADGFRVFKLRGWAIYHRPAIPKLWPEHYHAVLIGHPTLDPAAAAQVESYLRRRNGLKGDGPDPDPWRPDPIPTFSYAAARRDETLRLRIADVQHRIETLRTRAANLRHGLTYTRRTP